MIAIENQLDYLLVAVFEIDGLSHQSSTLQFEQWVELQCQEALREKATQEWEARREAVRALLRKGGFKPSGRSKPAQEYLARCLDESKFPRVHPAVDCLNAISVRSGIPISMLDRAAFSDRMLIRLGKPGESYVFNSVGQELDLENLIVVCGGSDEQKPLGTPVKDSMAGKIDETVSRIVCILYAPQESVSALWLEQWALMLQTSIQQFAT
ncbi:MAG: phenylalanine--tRNA ligase beta subunit-related protein [Pirellula sp.]